METAVAISTLLNIGRDTSAKRTVYIPLPDGIDEGDEFFIMASSRDAYTQGTVFVPVQFS